MTYQKKTRRKYIRKHTKNRYGYGDEIKAIFDLFIKPILKQFHYKDEEMEMREGINWFFNSNSRSLYFCKAKESFSMPGRMWKSLSHPGILVPGTSWGRYVEKGARLVTREDDTMPDRNEIEFNGNMFVLTKAEWNVIEPKLERIA